MAAVLRIRPSPSAVSARCSTAISSSGGTIGAYMIEDDRRRLQQLVRSDYHYAPSSDFICLGYKDVDICACGAAISYVDEFVKKSIKQACEI